MNDTVSRHQLRRITMANASKTGLSMSSTVASNAWAEIVHHASDGILEERWLPGQMTDGAFMASLALLALEAERLRPSAILIDATQFQYRPGPSVMEWRNNCIIPRYGSAGVRKFALLAPAGFPDTIEEGGKEVIDGPAIFPTAWFSGRGRAIEWLKSS